ncbi:hypothetical protein L227DRAFT_607450 [Lentinus tigrinus ALCF2SS1-6]|uniref:Arrestin C-terminal-like domain-containing protein n=1 Tax=Lentinus tigrinus ALCF2SS1-6 TaxID=1328759 RepID=A0A5C2SM40_9APHY|nr:hypothetical protein L227DRAFT_607450 [Lentinus tigrinus ALCF2SS1-6]
MPLHHQPEALSIPRSRLVEVEYTIRVTVSAGALTPDVHVTLPVRIINFLSVDPTPSEPLLSRDGAYTRLIPYEQLQAHDSLSRCDSSSLLNVPSTITQGGRYSDVPSLATAKYPAAVPSTSPDDVPSSKSRARRIPLNTPLCMSSTRRDSDQEQFQSTESTSDDGDAEELDGDLSMSSTGTSESDSSMFSAASLVDSVSSSAGGGQEHDLVDPPTRILGNLELDDDADSDEEVDLIVGTAQLDSRPFPEVDSNTGLAHLNPRGRDSDLCVEEASSRDAAGDDNEADARAGKSLAMLRQSARRRREEQGPLWRRSDMRYDLPGSVRGPRHIREAAASRTDVDILTHDEVDVVEYAQDEDEDEGDTPRLGSSACPRTLSASHSRIESIADAVLSASPPISASSSISSSSSGSQQRPSRQLPQPPSRHGSGPSQLSDIPTSVSALEAIRLSRLSGSSGPGSTLSRSSACHSLPTTPARTLDDSGNAEHCHSARWRPAYERSETVPPSLSATAVRMTLRPTHALRKMGESECSVVKGRIAAFEERLKLSRDTGAAYA